MYRISSSPSFVLQEFFQKNELVFQPSDLHQNNSRYIDGEVYNPKDFRIVRAKRFFFKKFGEDKLRWNKICTVKKEKFYGHREKITFSVHGRANEAAVKLFAQTLAGILNEDFMMEVECEEKVYVDSKKYAGDREVEAEYSDFVAGVSVAVFALVIIIGVALLAGLLPAFQVSSPGFLAGTPVWEKLAIAYWVIRFLMLFFTGV